jgi:hypothetical protein
VKAEHALARDELDAAKNHAEQLARLQKPVSVCSASASSRSCAGGCSLRWAAQAKRNTRALDSIRLASSSIVRREQRS